MKPSFSVCVVTRNGARTLNRLFDSLREHQTRGGEVIVMDTGSSDGSADLARSRGAVVHEVGERFLYTIDADLAKAINDRFVVAGEEPIVHPGSRLFHFADARNHCASFATNDWISWADDDEAFMALNLDKLEEILADPGLEHVEYDFIFAHAADGVTPAVRFTQSKMYRRSRMYWTGAVHELVTPLPGVPPRTSTGPNRVFLDPVKVFRLEHWQDPNKDHRANYLPGLGWDAYMKLTHDEAKSRDRQWHYLGREMLWLNRPASAKKVLLEHIEMNGWPAERAQSMIFLGDCEGQLGDSDAQVGWYHRAFQLDPTRRESLMRLANFYRSNQKWHACAAFAGAALQIPWHPYYANQVYEYREGPHKLLYMAKGWMGDADGAREHLIMALNYAPQDRECLRDTAFYGFPYVDHGIEGWMAYPELLWLFDRASRAKRVLEVGSWKGRSTHALCKGAEKNGGTVWAVDHFSGSVGEDVQHAEAKSDPESIFRQFTENTKDCPNLVTCRGDSLEISQQFPDAHFDLLFLDGSHDEASVRLDIQHWARKVKGGGLLCGHDFGESWPGVVAAVAGELGGPDGVHYTIWRKQRQAVAANPLLLYLTQCVRDGKPASFIKLGDGESACMDGAPGANCDGHPYTPELGWKLRMAFSEFSKMAGPREGRTWVNVVPFEDQPAYNCLLHRNDSSLDAVTDFWRTVRESAQAKVFVGPERLQGAANLLRCGAHVEVPLVNAFAQYDQIREQLRWLNKPGTIFVFCAGMTSKVLMADLLMRCQEISCLDGGSAWDPLFVGQTRTEQLPITFLRRHYAEWLKEVPSGNQ